MSAHQDNGYFSMPQSRVHSEDVYFMLACLCHTVALSLNYTLGSLL